MILNEKQRYPITAKTSTIGPTSRIIPPKYCPVKTISKNFNEIKETMATEIIEASFVMKWPGRESGLKSTNCIP